MDSGLFSEYILKTTTGSCSRGKSGVAKALGLIGQTLGGSAQLLVLVCLSEKRNIQFHLHLS